MVSAVKQFIQGKVISGVSKLSGSEAGVATYLFFFIIAATIFTLLNISLIHYSFAWLLDYVNVYLLFTLVYAAIFVIIYALRKKITRSIKNLIISGMTKK